MSKVLRYYNGDYLFQKSINIAMNGEPPWKNQPVSLGIFNRFQAFNLKRQSITIPLLLPHSVKEYIFSKLLDESVDLLKEQVSPDKHRIDFFIC